MASAESNPTVLHKPEQMNAITKAGGVRGEWWFDDSVTEDGHWWQIGNVCKRKA